MRWMLWVTLAAGCGGEPAATTTEPPASPGPALINGDFAKGFEGWTLSGDADRFRLFQDEENSDRWTVSTDPGLAPVTDSSAIQGELSQEWVVPTNALALRFVIFGGKSHVKLTRGAEVLREVIGNNDPSTRLSVSWPLRKIRGEKVRLAIVDDESDEPWGWVSVSGFDVVRRTKSAITNGDFEMELDGWSLEGDAENFTTFTDPLVGGRTSLTTFASEGPNVQDSAMGRMYQDFMVPDDATALRFVVHGGRNCFVRLYLDGRIVAEASGRDSNSKHAPYSFDLVPLRGKTVQLSIEDKDTDNDWAFLGTTGFDLLTTTNGP